MASTHQSIMDEIQGRRSGAVTRGIAFVIDFLCVLAAFPLVMWGIGLSIGVVRFERPVYPEVAVGVGGGIQFLILFLYFVGPWSITGRTLGQALLGLRVVGRRRPRINPLQAALRWAVLFLSLPVIGPVWLVLSGKRLALHDRVARTEVIYDRARRQAQFHVDKPAAASSPADQAAPWHDDRIGPSDAAGAEAGTMVQSS